MMEFWVQLAVGAAVVAIGVLLLSDQLRRNHLRERLLARPTRRHLWNRAHRRHCRAKIFCDALRPFGHTSNCAINCVSIFVVL
jgi:hypothetical protein